MERKSLIKQSLLLTSSVMLFIGLNNMALANNATPQVGSNAQAVNTNNAYNRVSWLGVSLSPLSDSLTKQMGSLLGNSKGVLVNKVKPDSPAERSGIRDFDIITEFNGQTMNSVAQVNNMIRASKSGVELGMTVLRSGKKVNLSIILGELKFPVKQPQVANPTNTDNNKPFWQKDGFMPGFKGFDGNNNWPGFNSAPWNWKGNNDGNNFLGNGFPNGFPGFNSNSYGKFQSLNVQKGPGDYARAEVIAQDTTGNSRKFVFEGKQEVIYQQVLDNKDLPDDQKKALVEALDDKFSSNIMNQMMNPFDNNFFDNNGNGPFNFGNGNGFNPGKWW